MNEDARTFRKKALKWLEGDQGMFEKLTAMFLKNVPKQMAALEASIATNDLKTVELHAHTLKGTAGMIGEIEMRGSAAALESAAISGDPSAVIQNFDDLKNAVQLVTSALSSN